MISFYIRFWCVLLQLAPEVLQGSESSGVVPGFWKFRFCSQIKVPEGSEKLRSSSQAKIPEGSRRFWCSWQMKGPEGSRKFRTSCEVKVPEDSAVNAAQAPRV